MLHQGNPCPASTVFESETHPCLHPLLSYQSDPFKKTDGSDDVIACESGCDRGSVMDVSGGQSTMGLVVTDDNEGTKQPGEVRE